MFKYLIVGIWVCAVTLGASYMMMSMASEKAGDGKEASPLIGLDYVKVNPISVPIIRDGGVQGYVIAQFVYTADAEDIKDQSVPIDLYFNDRVFALIYQNDAINFEHIKKTDLTGFMQELVVSVNKRLGTPIVQNVLVEQFNFVPIGQIRCKRDT